VCVYVFICVYIYVCVYGYHMSRAYVCVKKKYQNERLNESCRSLAQSRSLGAISLCNTHTDLFVCVRIHTCDMTHDSFVRI